MAYAKGDFILAVAVIGLLVQVNSLSSKRVFLKLGKADFQQVDGKINVMDTNNKNVEEDINSKSNNLIENEYFTVFQSYMDRLFKRYENEILLEKINKARLYLDENTITRHLIKQKENDDMRFSDTKYNDLGYKINGNNKNSVYKNYENDVNNERDSNDYNDSDEDNYLPNGEETDIDQFDDESKDSDNDIREQEDSDDFFEGIEEEQREKEFGMFDYLAASKESYENNINALYNRKYEDAFIPDDYFDNSDYES